mgnify:FL=1
MKKPFSKLFNLKQQTNDQEEVTYIAIEKIVPNRYQPRVHFDKSKISELADSIKEHGLLQPIVVRPIEEDMFEIIAGERRFRASKMNDTSKVQCIIKDLDDQETAAIALIENIQRENLSAIEEAKAYLSLMSLSQITQKELALSLGKSQSFVANKVRLLKLSTPVIQALNEFKISERHARAMISLSEPLQIQYLNEVITEGLTVKQLEQRINVSHETKNDTIDDEERTQNDKNKITSKDVVSKIERSVLKYEDQGVQIEKSSIEHPEYTEVTYKIYHS